MDLEKNVLDKFIDGLIRLNKLEINELVNEIINEKDGEIMFESLIFNSMIEIGYMWDDGELALSQVYMSGVMINDLIEKYYSSAMKENKDLGIGILTFLDNHVLGKKIVQMVLKANGYKYKDLGSGVQINEVIERVKDNNIKILLISTLLLNSAYKVKEIRDLLDDDIIIVVGGAPFRINEDLYKLVGANYYGRTASDILNILDEVIKNG